MKRIGVLLIALTLLVSGIGFLSVEARATETEPKSVENRGVGDYTMSESEPNNYTSNADRIYNDYTVSGYLYRYDIDKFKFVLSSRSYVQIVAVADYSTTYLALYDSTDDVINGDLTGERNSSGTYNYSIQCYLNAGTYYIGLMDSSEYHSYDEYMFYYSYTVASCSHSSYTSSVTRPTCETAGYTTYTCRSCGHQWTGSNVSATGHSYVNHVCSVCDKVEPGYTDADISSIAVTTKPGKISYNLNESLNVTGGKVTVYYKNGYSKVVELTASMVSGFSSSTSGKKVLTVTYAGKTCTFEVTIKCQHNNTENKPAVAASCKQEGYTAGVYCKDCKTYISGHASIAKTNDHSYGAWSKASSTQHKRTCSVCNNVETVNHTWNSGSVTKQATCKETGVKAYACTVCGATKTETIAKTDNHRYGNWSNASSSKHECVCSVCSKVKTASHTWDSGSITKQPTCNETGIKAYCCTTCAATKTETVEKNSDHSWNDGEVLVAATCEEAGKKECTCVRCGVKETVVIPRSDVHSFLNGWNKDKTNHWHECSVCTERIDYADHTWNSGEVTKEATNTETGIMTYTCTVCGATWEGVIDKVPYVPTEPTTPESEETVSQEKESHDSGEKEEGFPIWVVVVTIVVVGGAGLTVGLVLNNKRKI